MPEAPDAVAEFRPLLLFYERFGGRSPTFEPIVGDAMPEPYRSLLVHDQDMTPTLAAHYGEAIHIRVLDDLIDGQGVYCREVVLVLDETRRIIEFGGIRIYLAQLPDTAREVILAGKLPLGRILADHCIPHSSRPSRYFAVAADDQILGALGRHAAGRLYGRCNVISLAGGEPIAEVVEILPR